MHPEGENVILLLGAPRSGTTWLAKIFDSHPRVLYRHEPDTVLRSNRLPNLCAREAVSKYRDEARRYLSELMDVRTLKAVGSLPQFPKTYYSTFGRGLREGIVYSLRAVDAISRGNTWARRVAIPDLVARTESVWPTVVFKSVSSFGRARLFAEALPKSRIVFILRHPCGQVASTVRGIVSGKFEYHPAVGAVVSSREGRALGLTAEEFGALSPVEKCAWHWVFMNQKALNDLSGLEDRVKVVRYEDACADPERVAKELFAFSGLDWNSQTASFVKQSTTAPDTDEFYRVWRDSLAAASKWRTTLSAEDQQRILDIAGRVPVGQMFLSS
jgi:hypothetical protein